MTTTLQKTAEVKIITPLLDVINPMLAKAIGKNLTEITKEASKAVEIGMKTDATARTGEETTKQGIKALKFNEEVRLHYVRQIREGEKRFSDQCKSAVYALDQSITTLKAMGLERQARIEEEETKIQEEAERKQHEADEKARREEERRRKISLAQGGKGEVKPVEAEKIEQPVGIAGLRKEVRTRSIPDIAKIKTAIDEGVRKIEGVKIYQVWQYEITDAKTVPDQYRKTTRA